MTGAILAAGRGHRMNGRYAWLPKTLLPVGGRPILWHQLRMLRSLGVRRVVVLVGHLKELVRDYLETTGALGLEVETVEQPEPKGVGHGLLCLRARLPGPFVLFLGDIFIVPRRLAELAAPVAAGEAAGVLAVTRETDLPSLAKNFRVDVDAEGRVVRVVEKPSARRPALKGCGVYALTPAIFTALDRTAPNASGELCITDSIQTLIELGHPVRAASVSEWDVNVTTAEDLALADRRLLAHREARSA